MTVANPSDLRLLEGPAASTGTTLAAMAEAYGAPKITIAFSMGHAQGSLFESARGLIQSLITRSAANDVQVEKLRSYVEGESEPIDFLDELLIFRETLDLHDRDPDINFEIKRNYLRQVMHGLT
ncbi:hypothetical protein B2G69_25280 [Methylorubrum zatmanii]|nr:hypothetical protein B2G69_25280 [Methylorubrum zatmanii]